SFYARRAMGPDLAAAHRGVADLLGVGSDEVVLTRNATEALRALIVGYRAVGPGDAVLCADHDYDAMLNCMAALRERRGVELIRIALPHPASYQGLIDAYAAALEAHPRVRLVLLTHLGHRSGLVLPVAEIAALAKARGADVIVDAAHSLGQLDTRVPELGADFIGVNLHKWIGAPLGVGAMVVRRGRQDAIATDPAASPERDSGIAALMHTGTVDFAAVLALPTALAFQQGIGAAARAARLRALRNRWTAQLGGLGAIDILTPDDSRLHGAITSFRLRNTPTLRDHEAFAARLLEAHRVFTVVRTGLHDGPCIRVTPALANTMDDCDRLVHAVRASLAS
ncbi:MAG: aminotransferase class V-fold PLP-dependent enzyme, partial [Sphingomonadales bacterium]|nr:aminotransferase class V-fold PLP-dependent enzyme [Sphingomonadales bacterium]